jgi:hypothetical protein
VTLRYSIGLFIDTTENNVMATALGSPAFKAGLTEATPLVAVNGVGCAADARCDAIRAAPANRADRAARQGRQPRSDGGHRVHRRPALSAFRARRGAAPPARLDELLAPRKPSPRAGISPARAGLRSA